MYREDDTSRRQRAAAGVAALAIHALLGAALIYGLAVRQGALPTPQEALTTLDFTPPPPPPPPAPERTESAAAPAAPAPEGRKGDALPREAPAAAIPLNPQPAAPRAGEGRDTSDGAGTRGTGPGAGGQGAGTGGGGDGGVATPARRIAGALNDRDYPREAEDAGLTGTVGISFRVRTDGRVDRCAVVRSSGHALLDGLTCRLFTDRFRFRPATDAAGAAVESTLQTSFTWGIRGR